MCLFRVDKSVIKGKKIKSGYKIFTKVGGKLRGEFWGDYKPRSVGEWLDEKNFRDAGVGDTITATFTKSYSTGWHVYLEKGDAELVAGGKIFSSIRKVRIKGIRTVGVERFCSAELPVVVCEQIFIEKE